ncbi:MAG: bifunctional phosphoribosylaminoimidazolecarboxamide formyltransferase/IMP cyclohydrolase [Acidimicrobiales bacterium]|jgi:phosphoribosylaminoimidazolecarboxamide formyltransferase/IMP cyclohydrolase|nr:bifunctional phosphoribosylaminoimidazolecarboxamide formyltransferase/IMP cyclohydrolase [Acidimicrobiales bacterium]MDP6298164.1 bifunctional phosphoribosylaminoimidazolecarboxamide formyltransferase/IMP cyclohydrolase [Acidimicrobiales bacterium]HJM28337.1 bifunctional phosphoribosylaminoimidazolecarboxamide formyltransferase/IMP cyclohydrolase [Acidimicrobiales bacterium]HJM98119.1 bifunctional phosphoribosylaminoimidazolecarboxamide formyltransferase/IMP cyclohydrolase [Acidimicrobiales 
MKALLSVFDKIGITEFALGLHELGWELLSSGGTAKQIADAGIPVTDVADYTGSPIMLGHRVVTLHPKIHGGILADRENEEHQKDLKDNKIETIDLVVCNLYPFQAEPGIENIDIGGPTMVRAAAKNHEYVGVIVDPIDYDVVLVELNNADKLSSGTRRMLARKAFAHTAAYDAAIVSWIDDTDQSSDTEDPLPDSIHLALERVHDLRYGENPHQVGARYKFTNGGGWWDTATKIHGKEMSYLNLFDTEAAWRLVHSMGDEPTVAVIKHANPCGIAAHEDITEAYVRANACDPVSAFGGIVAVNREVPVAMAEELSNVFTEVIVAPSYTEEAIAKLTEKKNIRIIEAHLPGFPLLDIRSLDGGLLVQTCDRVQLDHSQWTIATSREPTENEWIDLEFAWRVAAKVSSNCIVLAKDKQAFGIGAGQQNRRDAGVIAAQKADGRATGGVCASDAFFPFTDGLDAAIEAGCTAVIQPGGSIRDQEVIDAANEAGLTMVFTGERHFKH